MHSSFSSFFFYIACFILAFTMVSCGELELPQVVDKPTSSTDQTNAGKDDEDDKEDTAEGDPQHGNEGSKDEDAENPDEDNPPTEELQIGSATFTVDGHLLIAGSLYLSLGEFNKIESAFGENPQMAAETAASYVEGNLKDWRVPTEKDVTLLRDALACVSPYYDPEHEYTLPLLNLELSARGYANIYREWYIYGDATRVFGFTFDETEKKASASSTYLLRLVHDK